MPMSGKQKNRQTVARGTNRLKQNKILIYNKEREKRYKRTQ